MPPNDSPYGPDTLVVPAYLASSDDEPGLIAWKAEHPDWFVAGTWTRPARRRGARSPEAQAQHVASVNESRRNTMSGYDLVNSGRVAGSHE